MKRRDDTLHEIVLPFATRMLVIFALFIIDPTIRGFKPYTWTMDLQAAYVFFVSVALSIRYYGKEWWLLERIIYLSIIIALFDLGVLGIVASFADWKDVTDMLFIAFDSTIISYFVMRRERQDHYSLQQCN